MNNFFKDFLIKDNIKRYSRFSSLGDVFAERFNRTVRNLLKKPVFERRDGNWIDLLSTIAKQYNDAKYSSIKLEPTRASLKKNEGYVY